MLSPAKTESIINCITWALNKDFVKASNRPNFLCFWTSTSPTPSPPRLCSQINNLGRKNEHWEALIYLDQECAEFLLYLNLWWWWTLVVEPTRVVVVGGVALVVVAGLLLCWSEIKVVMWPVSSDNFLTHHDKSLCRNLSCCQIPKEQVQRAPASEAATTTSRGAWRAAWMQPLASAAWLCSRCKAWLSGSLSEGAQISADTTTVKAKWVRSTLALSDPSLNSWQLNS